MGGMKTERRYLSSEELRRVVEHVRAVGSLRERGLLALLLLGLRIGEVVGAKRSQLDAVGWTLTYTPEKQRVPKVHRVPVPSVLRSELELVARRKPFPPDWSLLGFDRWRAWKLLKRWGAVAGVPWLFPHALRHTFAITWIESGGSLSELQSWLGHADPKTTTQYLRWSTKHLEGSFDKLGLAALLGAGLSERA